MFIFIFFIRCIGEGKIGIFVSQRPQSINTHVKSDECRTMKEQAGAVKIFLLIQENFFCIRRITS